MVGMNYQSRSVFFFGFVLFVAKVAIIYRKM